MSLLNLSLILIATGLWSLIYIIKFKENIERWYHTRFDKSSPPLPPDGIMPEVPLPFCYDPPKEDNSEETKLPAAEAHATQPGSDAETSKAEPHNVENAADDVRGKTA